MEKVAKFQKVSYERFKEDWLKDSPVSKSTWSEEELSNIYDNIKLPIRATTGSAGYDFIAPIEIVIKPGETKKIPTGIRCEIIDGWALFLFPRSSLGFKYRLQLDNTVGIIDSDFYWSDNEGHIFVKLTNDSRQDKTVVLNSGFCQGIFLPFGITFDDDVKEIRNGGIGSTDKK